MNRPARSTPRDLLVHADVGRTGLGNMLFSWARAEVFSRTVGAPMLAPQWTQTKIGPLLRGEKDLRYYLGLFDNRSYVRGPARTLALLARRRIDGADIGIHPEPRRLAEASGALVVFRGWDGWFRDDLLAHHELIRARLESIVTERVRAEIRSFGPPCGIALHVRRGDMGRNLVPPGEELKPGNDNVVQSEYYFVAVLRTLRRAAGTRVPATIFTDARAGELPELAAEEDVRVAPPHTAISDMLLMSRFPVLVTSSASSFSAWASYLGAMPTIWGRNRVGFVFPQRPELAIVSDPHGGIDESDLGTVAQALRGADTPRPAMASSPLV